MVACRMFSGTVLLRFEEVTDLEHPTIWTHHPQCYTMKLAVQASKTLQLTLQLFPPDLLEL